MHATAAAAPHVGLPASAATVLWTQIAVLLLLARLLGAGARRLGQPPIVGSLLAGLLAGPSVFGQIWPSGFAWFHPPTQLNGSLLTGVADFSLLILLISLGAETDLPLIRRLGRPAASIIVGSLVLPLAVGAVVAAAMPDSFLGAGHHRVSYVLLLAAALAVSSLPVIARMMTEMGLTRRDVGQLSIAAATVNDVIGFVALALATALVGGGGSGKLALAIGGFVGVVVVLATVGQRLVDTTLRRTRSGGPDVAAGVAVCVVVCFATAAVAQALGIDAALGAFLAGITLGRSRFIAPRVVEGIQWFSDAVFAPLYFATAGLSVDVTLLGHGSTGLWFAIVLVAALAAKFAGVFFGGRIAGLPSREATGLGVSLNGRGAMQVILGTAGLAAGVLDSSAFTVIILLSIISSVAAPPVLRRILRDWRGSEDEQQRLEHEEEMSTNVVVRGQRLLLPTRGSPNSVAAARIIDLAWPQSSEVTMLRLASAREYPSGIDNVLATLTGRQVREERTGNEDLVSAILEAANLGYGAIAVGAADQPTHERLLPEFIEALLNHSPIPLVVVRRGDRNPEDAGRPVIRPRRILLPITGNAASRAGQEVAREISRNTGADLRLLHVVTRPPGSVARATDGGQQPRSATAVVQDAQRQAAVKQLPAEVNIREGAFAGEEIEQEAVRTDCDLVVLGTTVRRVEDRPFLGHTVEHLLEHLTGPTIVVVVLPDAQQAGQEHVDRRTG